MLLLCALIVGSGTMWAQSDKSAVYTSNVTLSTSGGTNASTCKVIINTIEYDGIKVGTSKAGGAWAVTVPSGTKYLHLHVAAWNGVTGLSLNISPNTYSSTTSVALTADTGISSNSPFTFSGTASSSNYYKVITFTSPLESNTTLTFTTSANKRFVVWGVNAEEAAAATYAISKSATNGTISTKVSSSEVTSAAEDATVTIEATPNTGYTFSSWNVTKTSGGAAVSVANGSANPTTFTMPAEAVTVAATFTINTHALDLTSTNGTCAVTVNGEDWDGSSAIAYGADVEITATPDDGYLFDEWDHTLTSPTISSNVISFTMPDDDVVIKAKFVDASTVKSITISDAIEHGTVTASSNTASAGDEITLTATPDAGYAFSSWSVVDESSNVVTVTNNKFTMPDANVTVSATFTAIPVTGVSLNKTSTTISVGETETLTATVAPSNALNKAVTWTSSNTDVAMVANGVVTAKAAGSATITVTTTDGGFTATCAVTVVNAVTFTGGTDKGTSTSSGNSDQVEKSSITVSSTNAALAQAEYRLYSGSTTTISTSSGKITRIEFTVNGTYSLSNLSTATGTYNSSTGVWTGTATSVAFSASAQVRLDKIVVYYATTATPTFSVATGEYSEAKSVTISCATDGASIYYTTDGTTPTSSSTAYSSAISIVETTTLKAIAIKDGVDSEVASATYTMNRPAAPTFDVAAGVFDAAFDLHLATETDGATIYYTTDGSTPTTSSPDYSDKVAISAATTTVKAIAVKSGLTSDVASATYTYDDRTTPTFTLSTTSIDLKVNETSSAVTLTTNSDVTPSFTCADAHVTLTGTGNSRTISANAAGTYTVTVSVTNSENYKDASGTITVTVTKKATTMVLTPSFSSKDLYVTKTGSLTGVPQYNSSAIAGAAVSYSSSDTKVATIASDGTVTFKKAGSTTLTVSYEGNNEYEACNDTYVLDLTDTTPQATSIEISLNNTFFECVDFTNWTSGMATSLERTFKNVTVTYSRGTSQNMYCNADKVRFYAGNGFEIAAPSGYSIAKIVFDANISSAAPEGSISTTTWTGDASNVSFTFANKTDITSVTITLAPIVTLPAAIYATRCYKHALDFSGTGIKAYTVKVNAEKSTARVTEIASGKVPANEGVILYAEEAGNYAVPVTESASALDNDLIGVAEATTVPWQTGDKYNYILQRSGSDYAFNMANGSTLAANRAYLQTTFNAAAGARLVLVFDDETTGISDASRLMDNGKMRNDNFFNLKGQRVENPVKGQLYIVNGKKVVIK